MSVGWWGGPMVLEGVPASISREDYLGLTRAIGLEPKNLRSLEFRMDGIYAEVIARDADGGYVVDYDTNTVVTHRVYIPVEGEQHDDGLRGSAG